ncbi:scavenger receptor class B member 1 isoform X3 [Cavia porcellus]|uniref:scavenger receptor class B member 1 isoform X3 n=1 Tax=Cavia porcellus TaxID=10141 RepID=UPI002FE2FBE7
MGGRSRGRRAAAALGVAGLLCAALGVVMIILVPSLIRQQVAKNVRIDPSSLSFSMWREIPVPFYMSVYFFDVLNPDEVLQGRMPEVRERGPYVYRQFRVKTNISFHNNDTVSFRERCVLQFQPEKSQGSEGDYVMLPNILVMAASAMMEHRPMSLKLLMTLMFTTMGQRAFMNRTVGEVLWGYDDPLLDLMDKYFPGALPFKGKFGLFSQLNNSDSGLFTVFTGVKNLSRIHMVDKWNGMSQVKYWQSDQCNMINGTSGQMWPPFMTPETSLEFYSPDACRSMKLVYQKQGVFQGIPTYRFVAPNTLFANGSVYPPNEGFCPCLESGVQNVSTCRFGAPLFLSHPHFYNADPVLAERVLGLHPNAEEHALFLDIHPANGADPAGGPAAIVVCAEWSHGGRATQQVLQAVGAGSQHPVLRAVCAADAGLRAAARRRRPPGLQAGSHGHPEPARPEPARPAPLVGAATQPPHAPAAGAAGGALGLSLRLPAPGHSGTELHPGLEEAWRPGLFQKLLSK